jgi:FkbM family methyltransferase
MAWPLVRAYAHAELPRYGYLLHWFGMNDQDRWANAPTVRIRDRFHHHLVELDLTDFFQRIAYFFGCYGELDVLSACGACLRPGEAFLDGGANIGLVTLHAAAIVGPEGRVDACECNPRILPRLRFHAGINRLAQVSVHPVGLGERPAMLPLHLPGTGNAAAATLGPIPDRYGVERTDLGMVRIMPADDLLDPADHRPLTVKLDVEGFEAKVLRGMGRILRLRRPAIITEINPELLACNGDSVAGICGLLAPLGYRPFALDRAGFRKRHRLWLHPLLDEEVAWERDVLFVSEGSPHWDRLRPLMQPRGMFWRHIEFARAAAGARGIA